MPVCARNSCAHVWMCGCIWCVGAWDHSGVRAGVCLSVCALQCTTRHARVGGCIGASVHRCTSAQANKGRWVCGCVHGELGACGVRACGRAGVRACGRAGVRACGRMCVGGRVSGVWTLMQAGERPACGCMCGCAVCGCVNAGIPGCTSTCAHVGLHVWVCACRRGAMCARGMRCANGISEKSMVTHEMEG